MLDQKHYSCFNLTPMIDYITWLIQQQTKQYIPGQKNPMSMTKPNFKEQLIALIFLSWASSIAVANEEKSLAPLLISCHCPIFLTLFSVQWTS